MQLALGLCGSYWVVGLRARIVSSHECQMGSTGPVIVTASLMLPRPRRHVMPFSNLTPDHTKPRFAHLTPGCDSSFDGDIGFPIIYGKKTDPPHRRF